MTVRAKAIALIAGALVAGMASVYLLAHFVLIPSYASLEARFVRADLRQTLSVMDARTDVLDATTHDWASWDDAYEFVVTRSQAFIDTNLVDDTFVRIRVNVMAFLDTSGEVVYAKAYDPVEGQSIPVPVDLLPHLGRAGPLFVQGSAGDNSGSLLSLSSGPMLVSVRPLLTSDNRGPARGVLVMGAYLDDTMVEQICEATFMPVTVAVLRESLVLAEVAEARRFAVANDTSVTPLASNLVQGSVVLDDAYGEPVLLVSITRARDIYDEGQHTLAFFLSILVIAGVVVAGLALILADRAVFRRLSRLAAEVRSVGENPDFSGAVSVNGHDEIGFLAGTINETLEALARTHRQLRDSHKQLETATADLTRTQAELGISANRLRRLTRHLQTMREDERTVVANEIPDEVGQGLTALKMDLSVLERVVAKGEAVTPDFLRRMTEVVNSLLDTVRRLSSGLRPSMLEDLGLAEAVEWHLSEFQKERAVETTLRMHGPVGDVEASRALTLFRMLQEALLVIAEDASVTRVAVTLTIENRYALLAVQDNGTAVIEGDALSRREMGLGLIRERAEVFGGGVTIASIPGAGTTVVAQVPR